MPEVKTWTVKIWDGYGTGTFQRRGTYEQVVSSLAGYPASHIWSVQ